MKKYFLMLVVALVMPLVFTSCGDDDDDPDKVTSKFPYSLPVLNWGSSQTSVKSAMANSGYDLTLNEADALVYSDGDNFPMYTYLFNKGELCCSSLALSSAQDTDYDFQGFLEDKYGKAVDEDDAYWYYMGNNCIVQYGYAEIGGEDVWMATWVPADTRSGLAGAKEAAKASLELIKKVRNQ